MNTGLYAFRFAVVVTALFLRCNDVTVFPPDHFENLEIRVLGGTIGANLMPVVPADPVIARVDLLLKNSSRQTTFSDLKIEEADVFLDSSDTRLGSISFSTSWDGELKPGESDTVRLSKVMSPETLFTPPCRQYVRLILKVVCSLSYFVPVRSDSLLFSCVY